MAAVTVTISSAVIASGQFVTDSSIKKVQHRTGGIVGKLFVRHHDGRVPGFATACDRDQSATIPLNTPMNVSPRSHNLRKTRSWSGSRAGAGMNASTRLRPTTTGSCAIFGTKDVATESMTR